jgi:hypothetical protein
MNNFQQQNEFISNLVATYERQWKSPEFTAAVQNAQSLLTFLGILPNNCVDLPASEDRRRVRTTAICFILFRMR